MTRINCVPVRELTRRHLVAEYRELPRIFKLAKAWHDRDGDVSKLPPHYLLGQGHIRFFYDKLGYLLDRQWALVGEMQRRGHNPKYDNPDELIEGIPPELLGHWEPTSQAMAENRERIRARLAGY